MNLRSNAANSPSRRANWRALGLSKEDMEKPKIAVVNSSSELAICYAHLDSIARMVKEEIRAAGGVPFEVRTAAPSDFITEGQLSGLCFKGLTVAEVAPDAATGGPIGKVRDGDTMGISVADRSIDIDVPAADLAARDAVGYLTEAK